MKLVKNGESARYATGKGWGAKLQDQYSKGSAFGSDQAMLAWFGVHPSNIMGSIT